MLAKPPLLLKALKATLILEGSLARELGIPKARQSQVANDVISKSHAPAWQEQRVSPREAPTGVLFVFEHD